MKVLVVSGGYPSKKNPINHIFIHNQVKALQKRGIDISVLEIDVRSIRRKRKLGFFRDGFEGVTVYRMAIPCGPVPYLLPLLAKISVNYAFKKIVKTFGKPDILHAHFGEVAAWVIPIKLKYNIYLTVTEHFSKVMRMNRTKRVRLYSKKAYENADALIAVSNILRDNMRDLTNKNIVVVPNVLPTYFSFKNVKKSQNFTYMSVGNLNYGKRFDITIKAFSQINKKYPDTRLIIVGIGELEDELISLVCENNITEKTEFLGAIPNDKLPDIYSSCHCFVLPSMFETFGVVYAEAIACGIPVVATKCGGPEDFVNDSNGLIVPTDDLESVIGAMEYMYKNAKKYDGDKISVATLEKLNEERIGKSLVNIYENLFE